MPLGSTPSVRRSLSVPKPKAKLRKFNWQKIPQHRLKNRSVTCIWSQVLDADFEGQLEPNYTVIEELFAQKEIAKKEKREKKKESTEINLIDQKRSLNINIFLKQFKMPNKGIIDAMTAKEMHDSMTEERLKNLKKLLPDDGEAEIVKSFKGDVTKLGNADHFMFLLMSVKQYKVRIDAMIMKRVFQEEISSILSDLEKIMQAIESIKGSKSLEGILKLILKTGNFLNFGGYAGNADAFTFSSLLKLSETKANKPRMTLLHYVVLEAEKNNPDFLNLPQELQAVKKCQTISISGLQSEVQKLNSSLSKLEGKISKASDSLKDQFGEFLDAALQEMNAAKEKLDDMETKRKELADYLLEDKNKFALDECMRVCIKFMNQVTVSIKENKERVVLEERRKKRQEEQLKKQPASSEKKSSLQSHNEAKEENIIDNLLRDIKKGFKLQKAG